MIPSSGKTAAPLPVTRKPWVQPQIILERSLEVQAQDGGPGFQQFQGAMGPFGPLTT